LTYVVVGVNGAPDKALNATRLAGAVIVAETRV
jgi:hypothetical protein